jgi:hypothetical protein
MSSAAIVAACAVAVTACGGSSSSTATKAPASVGGTTAITSPSPAKPTASLTAPQSGSLGTFLNAPCNLITLGEAQSVHGNLISNGSPNVYSTESTCVYLGDPGVQVAMVNSPFTSAAATANPAKFNRATVARHAGGCAALDGGSQFQGPIDGSHYLATSGPGCAAAESLAVIAYKKLDLAALS